MQLSKEEYAELKARFESIIIAVSTQSNFKKLQHKYFLTPQEMDLGLRIYQILAAEIRQSTEKLFDAYIDKIDQAEADAEREKRKRGPRKSALDSLSKASNSSPKASKVQGLGKYTLETYDG